MKHTLTLALLLTQGISVLAQTGTDSAKSPVADAGILNTGPVVHKLKSNDAVLPRWAFDLNYRAGVIEQNIEMVDLAAAYTGSLSTSRYVQPRFIDGRTSGGDLSLVYFFNRRRTIGISLGGQFLRHTGSYVMDTMYADYRETFNRDTIYRQIIHTNGPIREDVRITNINVPLTLQFKHQFGSPSRPSNFGITGSVGAVFGFYNRTSTQNTSGSFSYESVYKLSPDKKSFISGFDGGTVPDPNSSLILTEANYRATHDQRDARSYFDSLRDQGGIFNVGLYKDIAESRRTPSANFNNISYGAVVSLGLSYALAYNVTFQLNGYFMYQTFTNTGQEGYRPAERVIQENRNYYSDYNAMTSGMRKADYTSYGLSAGFRIFFGEKRDVDGDKVPDAIDKCKLEYGEVRFNGCPDTDGDGIVDDQDACKFEKGPEYTNGCPDRDEDGVADKVDKCPDEYGELRNGCPVSVVTRDAPVDTTLIGENGTLMAPHIVLETDAVFFDLGKSVIKDSAAAILDYAAKILETNPKIVIHITGYTDDIGTYQNNLILSYERSRAARTYLISKGVSDKRIIISGYGTENPARPNTNEENRAKNRRIEFKLLLPL